MQLKTILCPIDFSEFSAAAYQHALSLAEHSFAQKENMEVIVMGTHGRRGFDHLVQGSTADRIMRKAACPVLVVPNTSQKALGTGPDGRHRLGRILYCTNFSNNSERARGYAISLAAVYSAELTLLHVAENAADLTRAEAIIAERTQELDKLGCRDGAQESQCEVGSRVRKSLRGLFDTRLRRKIAS